MLSFYSKKLILGFFLNKKLTEGSFLLFTLIVLNQGHAKFSKVIKIGIIKNCIKKIHKIPLLSNDYFLILLKFCKQ